MKKKILLLSALFFIGIGFSSCQKDRSEAPGQISGLGDTSGDLKIKESFALPEGVNLIGDITGIENPAASAGELKPVYASKSVVPHFGSGRVVRLKLTLLNTRNNPRTVFFPKGLLWKCFDNDYQTGLQCQITWVCLRPNELREIYVDLYCCNTGVPTPDQKSKYKILGVTSSQVLWDLLNTIGWRKINFEMIHGIFPGKGEEIPTYDEITDRLQTIVWNLTNKGIALSDEDKAFIESIPELAPEEIPVVDENAQFPEYFEEFTVSQK